MKKKGTTGRRREGGLNPHERFASVTEPDGSKLKVPAAKDAATFIYMADEHGNWTPKPLLTLLTDANWLQVGSVFELEEMRAGKGMGDITAVRVIDERTMISLFDGKYGQIKRLVLITQTIADTELADLSANDLLGGMQ